MASTWSALKIELLETGQNSGTWGTATNVNLGDAILGEAITGQATVDFATDADVTITLTDSATSQSARNLRLNITESSTGVGSVRNLILGSGCQIEKFYLINNTGTGAKTVKNTSGTGISVPAGKATLVYNNGTNVVDAASYFTSLTLGSALPVASGGTGLTAGTSGGVLAYTASGTLASSGALTASALVLGGGAGAAPATTTTGTGVVTALGVNTGSAGAFVVNGGALGSPSSVGTMPAFTLGGTVSGGGNQINNVIIGTSTPLAGAFTTVTASTPIGTASGGTGLGGATPFTSGGVVYASSSSALATGSALTFDGTKLNATALSFSYNTSYYNTDNSISNYAAGNYLYVSGNAGATSGLYLQGAGNQKQTIILDGNASGGNIVFQTNGSEALRLTPTSLYTASGINVAVGTSTSTNARFYVEGVSASSTPTIATFTGGFSSAVTSFSALAGLQLFSYQSVSGPPYTKTSAIIANSDGTVPSELQFWTKTDGQSSPALRATIDSAGNVGIGTSSPVGRLEAVGGTGAGFSGWFRTGDATAANNAGGGFYNTSSATAASRQAVMALDADGANLSGGDYFVIQKNGNSGTADILQYSNASIRFGTNYTSRAAYDMTLDSAGNLGIGVTPSAKLEVAGNIKLTDTSPDLFFNVSGGSNYSFMLAAQENVSNTFEITPSTTAGGSTFTSPVYSVSYAGLHKWFNGSTQAMTLDASGNLVIGDTTAGAKLDVVTNTAGAHNLRVYNSASGTGSYSQLQLQADTTSFYIFKQSSASTGLGGAGSVNLFNAGAYPMVFYTNSTERGRFTTSGFEVTGTLSASSDMSTTGNLTVGSSGNGDQKITTLQGYSPNAVNGSYGSLLFSANTNYTGGARRYLLTNALDYTNFAIICSADATTTPTLNSSGAVSSGTAAFVINTNATAIFNSVVSVGAATPSTSGAGITFPASRSASTDANTLDDFEEGTWTPTCSSSSGTITTVGSVGGTYQIVGSRINVQGFATITTNGTGSGVNILGGLPTNPSTNVVGYGNETSVTYKALAVLKYTTSALNVAFYDHTYAGANGALLSVGYIDTAVF